MKRVTKHICILLLFGMASISVTMCGSKDKHSDETGAETKVPSSSQVVEPPPTDTSASLTTLPSQISEDTENSRNRTQPESHTKPKQGPFHSNPIVAQPGTILTIQALVEQMGDDQLYLTERWESRSRRSNLVVDPPDYLFDLIDTIIQAKVEVIEQNGRFRRDVYLLEVLE